MLSLLPGYVSVQLSVLVLHSVAVGLPFILSGNLLSF